MCQKCILKKIGFKLTTIVDLISYSIKIIIKKNTRRPLPYNGSPTTVEFISFFKTLTFQISLSFILNIYNFTINIIIA